jgi:CTD kinase subunit beta
MQIFENPSKSVIGIERLMLESAKFDFRSRFPHKHVIKLAKFMKLPKEVAKIAVDICNDMYKTFAPLKQTTYTMATAVLQLASRITDTTSHDFIETKWQELKTAQPSRTAVMETMLDLLELYTHHTKFTILGPKYDVNIFIQLRISLNAESQDRGFARYTDWIDKTNGMKLKGTPKTPITPASPAPPINGISPTGPGRKVAGAPGSTETVRFMLDGDMAKQEKVTVEEFYKVEYEEYEIEVEEEQVAPRNERVEHGGPRNDRFHGGYRGRRGGRR